MSFISDFIGENIGFFFHLHLNKLLRIFAYNGTFKMRRRIIRKKLHGAEISPVINS